MKKTIIATLVLSSVLGLTGNVSAEEETSSLIQPRTVESVLTDEVTEDLTVPQKEEVVPTAPRPEKPIINTVSFGGVNYVSVEEMARRYNVNFTQGEKEGRLTGEGINVILPVAVSRTFYVNEEEYLAVKAPIIRDSKYHITAKDWATIFNMELTFVNGVSRMASASDKTFNMTDSSIKDGIFRVSKKWGNAKPETMVRNPSPKHVTTPVMQVPVYFDENKNDLEDVVQR